MANNARATTPDQCVLADNVTPTVSQFCEQYGNLFHFRKLLLVVVNVHHVRFSGLLQLKMQGSTVYKALSIIRSDCIGRTNGFRDCASQIRPASIHPANPSPVPIQWDFFIRQKNPSLPFQFGLILSHSSLVMGPYFVGNRRNRRTLFI